MNSQLPILILLPLLIGPLLSVGLGLLQQKLAYTVAILTNVIFVILAVAGFIHIVSGEAIRYSLAGWPPPFGIELLLDPLSSFIIVVIAVISCLVLCYAKKAVPRELEGRTVPFFSLALLLELGLTGMVLTSDLFNLYVFLEIASLAAYALMSVGTSRAPLSAFRYLLVGAMGGTFYLLGLGFLYVLTGSLNMGDVAARLGTVGESPALLVAILLIVSGFGLKMALFPMHNWLPDAYTHASSTATALIAPLMTKVSAYALIRLLFFVCAGSEPILSGTITTGIAWLSAAGVIVGSVMAIAQKNFKRMLAYSSISQISIIGLGIGMATPLALIGAILHILNHALMKSCLFLTSGAIEWQRGGTDLDTLQGIGRSAPSTGAALTIAALAMVGFPPTVGFFSKWYLVSAGLEAEHWVFVAVILGSSLLTAVYMFRVLERVYTRGAGWSRGHPPPNPLPSREGGIPLSMRVPTLILATAILVVGLGSSWLVTHLLIRVVGYV